MDPIRALGDRPFTAAEARNRGIGDDALRRAVRRGRLRRLHRGVYLSAAAVPTTAVRVRAAALATGTRLVASHETAAALWDVDVTLPGRRGRAEVRGYVPPGTRPPRRPGLRLTEARLHEGQVSRRGELLLTSPTRTALDLARERPRAEAVVVLDAFLQRGLTDPGMLAADLAALARQRRVRAAREALPLTDAGAESPMETRLRLLLVLGGLPGPTSQHEVRTAGGLLVGRVDLAYPGVRVAVEYDGREAHLEPGRFLRDRHRHHDLVEIGWVVLRFTADDVLRDPDGVVARVRRALLARRPLEQEAWIVAVGLTSTCHPRATRAPEDRDD